MCLSCEATGSLLLLTFQAHISGSFRTSHFSDFSLRALHALLSLEYVCVNARAGESTLKGLPTLTLSCLPVHRSQNPGERLLHTIRVLTRSHISISPSWKEPEYQGQVWVSDCEDTVSYKANHKVSSWKPVPGGWVQEFPPSFPMP